MIERLGAAAREASIMATLQELTHNQIEEAIRAGAERNVPATATIRDGASWANLQSRLMGLDGDHVVIAPPVPYASESARDSSPRADQ